MYALIRRPDSLNEPTQGLHWHLLADAVDQNHRLFATCSPGKNQPQTSKAIGLDCSATLFDAAANTTQSSAGANAKRAITT
jgi:hypothetical protein